MYIILMQGHHNLVMPAVSHNLPSHAHFLFIPSPHTAVTEIIIEEAPWRFLP